MAQGMMAHLITPALLVDRVGTLVFFNTPAARLLGVSYEEAGAMPPEEWAGRFSPQAADGQPLSPEQLPISIALAEGRPTYMGMRIHAADGVVRPIEVSAFPIVGRRGQTGALAIFWGT